MGRTYFDFIKNSNPNEQFFDVINEYRNAGYLITFIDNASLKDFKLAHKSLAYPGKFQQNSEPKEVLAMSEEHSLYRLVKRRV